MFCRAFGGVGCACADRRRGGIMLFAFAMSAVAWVFVLACSAATSTSPEIVLQTAWAAADVEATQGGATIRGTVYAGINLRVSQLEVTLAAPASACPPPASALGADDRRAPAPIESSDESSQCIRAKS